MLLLIFMLIQHGQRWVLLLVLLVGAFAGQLMLVSCVPRMFTVVLLSSLAIALGVISMYCCCCWCSVLLQPR